MNLALKEGESLEDSVKLTLTRREVLLLELCLKLVARDHVRNGSTCSDVVRLRERLVDGSRQNG
ncbi:MAG: hypothetical protein A2Z28_00055 [Chloroflexi bacterium RBG_16_51_9]|nr:MAG: hypothetical protein A2Z28_00055 [Chloroflexi bacterium RBG_16_51_9]